MDQKNQNSELQRKSFSEKHACTEGKTDQGHWSNKN